MSEMKDAGPDVLLRQARQSNQAALGLLLERYRNYLTVLARLQIGRRLQRKFDPADVVQEAFLQAHHKFSQFKGLREAELVAWMRQILASRLAKLVRHYCGTRGRDLRLEVELVDDLNRSSCVLELGMTSPANSPSAEAARREQAVVLSDALERLPEDYREVILLHQFQDFALPDVAQSMGRSLDSVKNLWIRALARLRRVLAEIR